MTLDSRLTSGAAPPAMFAGLVSPCPVRLIGAGVGNAFETLACHVQPARLVEQCPSRAGRE